MVGGGVVWSSYTDDDGADPPLCLCAGHISVLQSCTSGLEKRAPLRWCMICNNEMQLT